MAETSRNRSLPKSLVVTAGALLLAGAGAVGGWWLGGGRFAAAALGRDALARTCSESLVRQLSEKGFEPADVEFGESPGVGMPWDRERSYGSRFTFRDGAEQVRVDGVMACLVSDGTVTVDFRVGSVPRRIG